MAAAVIAIMITIVIYGLSIYEQIHQHSSLKVLFNNEI
jgi:hypothetical protein